MKFDVIIGNPPYQKMTGGGQMVECATPLYQEFMCRCTDLKPSYLCMIIPSRWLCGGKPALDDFRVRMVESSLLSKIYHFNNSKEIFENVDIAGGIQIIVLDRTKQHKEMQFYNSSIHNEKIEHTCTNRDLSKYKYNGGVYSLQYMIPADNRAIELIDKVRDSSNTWMNSTVLQTTPFGFGSDFEDSPCETEDKQIKVIRSSGRITWTSLADIKSNKEILHKWKVCTGYLNPDRGGLSTLKLNNIINKPFILKPNEVCTQSYLVLNTFDNEEKALNCVAYMRTKMVRFLISATLSGIHLTSRNFMFVPVEDYTKEWTDAELYSKYGITEKEIDYINSIIKPLN